MTRSSDSDLRGALEALDAAQDEMIARTIAWSAINSGSSELAGLTRMAAEIEPLLHELPGEVSRVQLQPSEHVGADGEVRLRPHGESLRLIVRPGAPIQIALTGHYDTVFPASHPFQHTVWRDSRTLNGPGVADMKGGIVVMLAALEAFERVTVANHVGYEVLLSPEEEIGSPASAVLLAELGAKSHVGMTYEPALADGSLAGARKGSGNFSLAIEGRAAHVGRAFGEGRNAVAAAADAVMRLDALNGLEEGVTVNVGAIDGGGPVNVVPERAVVRFNVRAPDQEARIWAESRVAEVVACLCGRDGIKARLHGGFTRGPKPMNAAQERLFGWARDAGAQLGLDIKWGPTGGVCEGNNLFSAGCPNIDTLGVRGGLIHSDQEFALADSFAERAKLSTLLLHGFASGRYDARSLRA